MDAQSATQGAGTKATVNHQVGISLSVFQGQGEPAIHKSPMYSPGFPGGATSKEPACQSRRYKKCGFDPWVGKIPWRARQPTPVFLPGQSHGQRSLAGYKSAGSQKVGHN